MGKRTVTALLVLAALFSPAQSHAEGTFRFPLFYEPASLDPARDELVSTYHVIQQVYDGLVAFDSNLRVVPGLAESWTVSRDGKLYDFELRDGVTFHNGMKLTADDVVASLTRIFHPDNKTSSSRLLDRVAGSSAYREGKADSIEGIRAAAPDRVEIQLTEPYSPLLSVLAMPMTKIAPRELILDPGDPLGQHPVGTGPFRFEKWDKESISLVANADHFQGPPALDGIRFVFYQGQSQEQAFADFLEGELDGCPVPGTEEPVELRDRGYQVLVRPRMSILFYGLNTGTPPLDDVEFRRAVGSAFDRETYASKVLRSKHVPARQIIPPGMPGYTPDNAVSFFNPSAAARHLEASRSGPPEEIPELVIASASHSDAARMELEMFRQDLSAIGIRVRPMFVESWEEFKAGIEKGSYSMYRYALHADIPDPEDLLPNLAATDAPHNFTGYSNPDLDRLFKKARGTTDTVARLSLYREAEKRFLEDAALIPVVFISTQVAFQGYVRNVELPATGTPYLPLDRISLEQSP